MKIRVELVTKNVEKTFLVSVSEFDTDIEKDAEAFLGVMERAAYNPNDFYRLLIERTDDARGSVPT